MLVGGMLTAPLIPFTYTAQHTAAPSNYRLDIGKKWSTNSQVMLVDVHIVLSSNIFFPIFCRKVLQVICAGLKLSQNIRTALSAKIDRRSP